MTARPHVPGRRSRDHALAELRELAARQVHSLATGQDWEAWLRTAARFPGWSFTNVMLIAAQQPSATRLAGYDQWHALGRHVRKGEPGIRILAEPDGPPATAGVAHRPEVTASGPRPRITYVWDVAQTSGLPVCEPSALPGEAVGPARLWEALTWLARREGFAVERADRSANSQTDWAGHRILVSPELDKAAAEHALLHELGHVLTQAEVPHTREESTAGCRGVRKVEADSVAFVVAARLGMDTYLYRWPRVGSWAGTDPRARPDEAVRAAGTRIIRAAAVIVSHLDVALFRKPADAPVVHAEERQPEPGPSLAAEPSQAPAMGELRQVLAEAERFYRRQLRGSWAPEYLAGRGLESAVGERWRAGYAPGGWTALTSHLHRRGHSDAVIEAAGLARRSVRGTLIDCFRDRVMLAVRDAGGVIAGFIGRARPDAGPEVPKYLNSPQTTAYRKGDLLFGLHEGRDLLERGAVPVIVEGPFDAIAVTEAGDGRYVGLAPCGTALTERQAAVLAEVTDLERIGALAALDGDQAGRKGIMRAYELLRAHTWRLSAVTLPPGRDPAEIMQRDGATALATALQQRTPLACVVIDEHLDGWQRQLAHPEGQLAAMRSAARLVGLTLPPATVDAIRRSAGRELTAELDPDLVTAADPDLAGIAQLLPPVAIAQILRIAERTHSTHYEVTAQVIAAASQITPEPGRPPPVAGEAQRTVMGQHGSTTSAPAGVVGVGRHARTARARGTALPSSSTRGSGVGHGRGRNR